MRHIFSRGALLNQTTWPLVTELESKHITAMIRRHVAISFCKPKVERIFYDHKQAERIIDIHCGLALHVYMIIGMYYHNQQVPIHCVEFVGRG